MSPLLMELINRRELWRYAGGNCRQMGIVRVFDSVEILVNANRIGEQAIELLNADECPSGTMDVVSRSDQMMLQIHESIGHALEIDRIFEMKEIMQVGVL